MLLSLIVLDDGGMLQFLLSTNFHVASPNKNNLFMLFCFYGKIFQVSAIWLHRNNTLSSVKETLVMCALHFCLIDSDGAIPTSSY